MRLQFVLRKSKIGKKDEDDSYKNIVASRIEFNEPMKNTFCGIGFHAKKKKKKWEDKIGKFIRRSV